MVSTADAKSQSGSAAALSFKQGQIVQEFGYDDDVDQDLRFAIEDLIEADLEDEDCPDLVDGAILWWRKDDGDLGDALVDASANLQAGGNVWVFTPKSGREGYVAAATIEEASEIAGLHAMNTISVATDWVGTKLGASRVKGGR